MGLFAATIWEARAIVKVIRHVIARKEYFYRVYRRLKTGYRFFLIMMHSRRLQDVEELELRRVDHAIAFLL